MQSNLYFNRQEESNLEMSHLINQGFLSSIYILPSQQQSLPAKKKLPRNQINNWSANGVFCLLIHQKHYLKIFIIDSDSWWEAERRELQTEYSFVFHLPAWVAMLPKRKKKPSLICKRNSCMEDTEFTLAKFCLLLWGLVGWGLCFCRCRVLYNLTAIFFNKYSF